MILAITILIPSAVLLLSMVFFYHKISKEEIIGQISIPLIISSLVYFFCTMSVTRDYELWGHYVVRAMHEEDWNEYVHQTCTRTVSCGKNCTTTETYDCSYVQYHPEKWYTVMNTGKVVPVTETHYYNMTIDWSNERVTGHNSGYTISGDIFTTNYDNTWDNMQTYTDHHSYENKIQASTSVFNYIDISEEEAKEKGLYELNLDDGFNYNSVYGFPANKNLEKFNSRYGSSNKIRAIVCVYKNKPMSVFEDQESYWCGGNQNEIVIGVGLKNGKVDWVNNFSWSDSELFKVELRVECEKQIGSSLNIDKIVNWLKANVNKWKYKNFEKDFAYIEVEHPTWVYVTVITTSFVLSIGLCVFFVLNDLDADRYRESQCYKKEIPRILKNKRNSFVRFIKSIPEKIRNKFR